jgi:acetylornithine/N-succinyldiaminopimelate aminotransferase
MIEVIQGESGVNPLDMQFVKDLEKFCKERDILLICDEVQSGNGRTGRLYGYFHYDIYPDIVTTAKGLGGGLPLGACLMFDKCEKTLTYGDHGSTFGGNPVACAGAISVLDRLTIQLMLEVQGKGAYLKTLIEQLPNVNYVSGMGLMLGVSITKDAKEVAKKCLEKGLIVLTAHDKIRLLPPLIINKEQIEKTVRILKEVLSQ